MQIKYLQDAPLGKKGDTAEIADNEAKILITLGYAEEVKPKTTAKKTTSKSTDSE